MDLDELLNRIDEEEAKKAKDAPAKDSKAEQAKETKADEIQVPDPNGSETDVHMMPLGQDFKAFCDSRKK